MGYIESSTVKGLSLSEPIAVLLFVDAICLVIGQKDNIGIVLLFIPLYLSKCK
jgi:hypothetical protein